MSIAASVPTICMDPWCLVLLTTGEEILFGYANRHPLTGGLSWMCSSPVDEFDCVGGRVRTRSGRIYSLGRRIYQSDIPSEGKEAYLAYELLLGDEVKGENALPRPDSDRGMARMWVITCKMARHLGLPPPDLVPAEISEFLVRHRRAYIALRAKHA